MAGFSLYICETKPIVVEGLLRVAAASGIFHVCGCSAEIVGALAEIERLQPEIILLGSLSPARSLLAAIPRLLAIAPHARIIVWPDADPAAQESIRCLQAGAMGVLCKSTPVTKMLDCLSRVAKGEIWIEKSPESANIPVGGNRPRLAKITPRERDIIEHLCRGLKNKEIADALGIKSGTVKTHLMHIFEKTGCKDRFQLAIHGRQVLDPLGSGWEAFDMK